MMCVVRGVLQEGGIMVMYASWCRLCKNDLRKVDLFVLSLAGYDE